MVQQEEVEEVIPLTICLQPTTETRLHHLAMNACSRDLTQSNANKRKRRRLRRLATVFLALGWIFSNQFLVRKACFDFHHTRPPFQPIIKFYVLVGFQATAVTIAMVTQSTSFWITSIISKSSQTLGNETFRI